MNHGYPEHMPSRDMLDDELETAVLHLFGQPPGRRAVPAPTTFITTIFAALKFEWDLNVKTACTNGLFLKFNPWFFLGLDIPTRCTVLAHECWHVAYDHMARMFGPGMRHRIANMAADHAINLQLKDQGYIFNTDHLADPRFTGMSAEEIYVILDGENPEHDPPLGNPQDGDIEPLPGDVDPMVVTSTIIRAYTASKMNASEAGSLPGEIESRMDELLNPKLPWHVLLARYLNEKSETGYNWKAPNRRYASHGIYMPSQGGQEGLSHIMWGFDTSGSMSDAVLLRANSEMKGAKDRLKPKTMNVIGIDTQINDDYEFTDEDDLGRLTFHGRGGTILDELFILAEKRKPTLLIVFSDMELWQHPPEPKGVPVLWMRMGKSGITPKFGKVIDVEV